MNFLMLRSNNPTGGQGSQPLKETTVGTGYVSKAAMTLEGVIAKAPFQEISSSEDRKAESNDHGESNCITAVSNGKKNFQTDNHVDVTEDKGFIIIPYKEKACNWTEAPNILSFKSLDRSFVFPGEQIQILACLSADKQDTEIITPFKVAAILNKNGMGGKHMKQNGNISKQIYAESETVATNYINQEDQHGKTVREGEKTELDGDFSSGESLLRMEDHKRQTEELLARFKSSHFFVQVMKSNELLSSEQRDREAHLESSVAHEEQLAGEALDTLTTSKKGKTISAAIDQGNFDALTSGGLARGSAECFSLSTGDIVVLLKVNVGVQFVGDVILEILQFEKHQETKVMQENQNSSVLNQDPSGELLKWLLPLDNSTPPPSHPIPPALSSSSPIRSTPPKPSTVSGSSSSQLFSFSNFRSYSMSSLPPNMTPPPALTSPDTNRIMEPDDWNQFSFKKYVESGSENEGLLSFRGVPLLPERFSAHCGLEGIFSPGRRWTRKIEVLQPVEIHSYSVDCNTDDLLCVNVKNVSPPHAPDVVVFVDAITIVFEEASKSGPPLYLPIACIESGKDFTLPNLALRRGEEHSFILKPATTFWKYPKGQSDGNQRLSRLPAESAASSWHHSPNTEVKHTGSPDGRYSVFVSCGCNYTESKLFFKHPTSWRPRISRDLMISVASDISTQMLGSDGAHLPVQVLTLRASNLTSENLTLTVLAPASFTPSPSILSLSNSRPSSLSPISVSSEVTKRDNNSREGSVLHGLSSVSLHQGQKIEDGSSSISVNQPTVCMPDVAPNIDLGCTHLMLQSRVPLGCVPPQSSATIKLEVLPLTDGIITLDSLQIDIKEKDLKYMPEHSLMIHATSSIASSIL